MTVRVYGAFCQHKAEESSAGKTKLAVYRETGMKYILNAKEMKAYDGDTSGRIGIPSMVLMERAALAAVEEILTCRGLPGKVLIVAGTGNNGGDGLAIGRLLAEKGSEVTFFAAGNTGKMTEETGSQLRILENLGFSIQSKLETAEYDMVVDALFGIGLSREIKGSFRDIVEQINLYGSRGAFVLSVDIPSGVCADTGRILGCAVLADMTVTFAFPKRGHLFYPGKECTGKLKVKEIGITEKSFVLGRPKAFGYEKEEVLRLLPERRTDGNKGTFGKVLLVAGSKDMCGACLLSGSSIFKAGAGMVKIITPDCNREIIQSTLPEAMLYTFEGMPSKEKLKESIEWADVIVAGPGLSCGESSLYLMEQILENKTLPMVIDADGLNLIASNERLALMASERENEKLILTPHPGELVRLMGTDMKEYYRDREGLSRALAERFHCIAAAKDAVTIVTEAGRDEIYINTSGNDGMACAGSGDVLAGIIGGLLAQKMEGFEAAALGVYLHGLAGEEAAVKNGHFSMTASDIIKALCFVMSGRAWEDK